ncbi:XAC2610-related protein [Pseudomonas chlororaphis]|uniref:XAC2610-related protein n=1 Tax=Pseudomonas chlororaphis TaxID=587753 RepID=UPI00406C66AA
MRVKDYFVAAALLLWSALVLAQPTTFSPDKEVNVTLAQDGTSLTVTSEGKSRSITETISFETEKTLNIEINDFNFDGLKDFSVWYVDDGMGTYTIHRVFIYQSADESFKELAPACGDEFLNLKLNSLKKVLSSTYYEGNVPKSCVTKPSGK